MTTATLNQQEQQAVAEIREKAARQRQHQEHLGRLQAQVDEVQDRIAQAEAIKSAFAARITQLQQLLLTLWGKERVVTNVDPTSQALDCYQSIATMRLAIEDFPRIRRHLESELSIAQQRNEFQRRSPK